MNWEFITETNLQLTETEHRYYGDIFLCYCDHSDNDSVPVVKAAELLGSANLPHDVILKILDICAGPKGARAAHLGRKQFYAALKLVAAHQAGADLQREASLPLDIITALPRFTWSSSEDEDIIGISVEGNMKGRSVTRLPDSTTESESEAESPREAGGSTDSPMPTNSVVQERSNEGATEVEGIRDGVSGSWQGLFVWEEQRQLLGTEEESSERHSSDEAEIEGEGGGASSFPPEEVWKISDEQRDYYSAQFAQLQPDPEGLLAGATARMFFEKSRLTVAELRHIWQLADVTRDGALSRQEFYVAMHLVVLRRNNIPLPDVLPQSLIIPASLPPAATISACSVAATASRSPAAKITREKSKEWTKFVDSPTGGTSVSLTSPGPKPVNFDFQKAAVERDPKILHPVPLRLTPEAAILASSANGTSQSASNGPSSLVDDDSAQYSAVTLVQRPLAKKPTIAQAEEAIVATPKKEPPPPPPPRPYRTHTRSSSLDLNKLAKIGQNFLGAPPLVPPRVSPGITSPRKLVGQKSEGESQRTMSESQGFVADFSHFSPKGDNPECQGSSVEANAPQTQQFAGACGAFHIYRKPSPKPGEGDDENSRDDAEEERALTLQELRDKNSELRLVCEELTRELAGALQERINLRAKLLLIT